MTLAFALTLVGLGFAGAVVAGMLGVGGAIVMIPLLLYIPPILGVGALDMKNAAGVTMVQVFVAALSGMIAHRRHRAVHVRLAVVGGTAMAIGTLSGALASSRLPDIALLAVFALMAAAAAILMFLPLETVGQPVFAEQVTFDPLRVVPVCLGVGIAAGLVGAGGAFLLVPLLLFVVGIPIRVTIGSSLAITTFASLAGTAGKLVTDQVPLGAAFAVALGAVSGAQLGGTLSRRVSGARLKRGLGVVVVVSAVRVWWDLIERLLR
jgi:uncharacterized membrane protein YfcA